MGCGRCVYHSPPITFFVAFDLGFVAAILLYVMNPCTLRGPCDFSTILIASLGARMLIRTVTLDVALSHVQWRSYGGGGFLGFLGFRISLKL